jgi:undecaprenyl-diphosphatase
MLIALKSAILGVIQGLTEFLPISSSGHLILATKLFGWHDPWLPGVTTGTVSTSSTALAFSVALHMGTLLALLIYFNREWIDLIKGFFTGLASRPRYWDGDQRLAWMIVIATVPAAVVGALVGDTIEGHLSTPFWVAISLLVVTFVMLAAQMIGSRSRDIEDVGLRDAGFTGVGQVLALAPGVSRSGITISGGLFSGLDMESAARFAFLMAAPIMAGAGILEGMKIARQGLPPHFVQIFLPGFVTAAIVGTLTVKYFLQYLRTRTLTPFIIYRFVVAAAVLIVLAVK